MNVFELEGSISLDSIAYEKAVKDAMKDGENLGKSLQENAKQFQAMQAQIDSLSKELADSKAEVSRMQAELERASKSAEGMGKETSKTSTEISEMSDKMKVLETRINATTAEYKEAQERVNELQKKLLESAEATGETSDETKQFAKELEKAERQAKTLEKKLDGLNAEYENERSAADKAGKETDEYGDSAEEAAGDTKKLDKEADKLGGTFDGLGSKIGKVAGAIKTGLVTAVKVGVGAVAAAGAAVSGIVMKSVSGFGEYEQLKGGAQKIFEGIDFTKIQKDADNAFKELNMNAAEYFGSINLAGASFTQTMGADKAYDTARRGMLAISDFATGTGKSIDELNQKYQMITRSTSSYQSIADQFSGILPQTSNDFLEQAQAAGLLSDEYQKLTEVPVAEYQEALTLMLEKGVEAQGLARNTVNESERTITGSVATAKKAWEDLIVAFSDPDADLGAKISNFVDSGKAALENLIPTIVNAMTGIGTAVKELAPVIGTEIPKLIQELVPPLIQATTGLISSLVSSFPDALKALTDKTTVNTVLIAVQDMLSAVMDGLSDIIELAPDIIPDLLDQVGNALINSVDIIGNAIMNMLPDISRLLTKSAPVLFNVIAGLVSSIGGLLTTLIPDLLPDMVELFSELVTALMDSDIGSTVALLAPELLNALLEGIIASQEVFTDVLPELIQSIFSMLTEHVDAHGAEFTTLILENVKNLITLVFSTFISAFVDLGIVVWEGIQGSIGYVDSGAEMLSNMLDGVATNVLDFFANMGGSLYDFKENVIGKIGDMVGTVSSKISGLVSDALTWGRDLIDNFVSGISENVYKVGEAVGSVAGKVKDLIGFSEPKEGALSNFHTFAPDMIDLFAQGIRDNADEVYREIRALSEGISTDINANVAVGGTGAEVGTGGSITVQVINNWDGTRIDSELDMAEIIQSMSDRAVIAMSERLEQLRIFDTRAYGGVVLP